MPVVASALSKKVRYHGLPSELARAAYDALPQFISEFVTTETLIQAAFALSIELRHAVQDCIYPALVIERRCALATSDLMFAVKVRDARVGVDLLTIAPLA